mmetsp:Transcript_123446/g.343877  ORF Transcript_123446/g.343877 Transcript_123446/m.343877 type:complete len:250 (+) Transcript_123446:601-1350(+)
MAATKNVALAVDLTQLVIDVCTANEFGLMVDVGPIWQVSTGQYVRKADHCPVVWKVEVRLVHCCKKLPHLLIFVNWPLAERILIHVSIRKRILVIEQAIVPREEGHNEELLAHGCRRDVNTHRITGLEDGMQLYNGVVVRAHLGDCDPHLMASRCVEDTSEFGLQHTESTADLMEGVCYVTSDYQNVVLEFESVDAVHPLLVDPYVKVHIRASKDSCRAFRPPLVHVESALPVPGWCRAHTNTLCHTSV